MVINGTHQAAGNGTWSATNTLPLAHLTNQFFPCRPHTGLRCIFNRNAIRCRWADWLGYTWKWTAFFEDKTRIDRFLGGFLTHANTNKDAESHEFRIFKKVVDYLFLVEF